MSATSADVYRSPWRAPTRSPSTCPRPPFEACSPRSTTSTGARLRPGRTTDEPALVAAALLTIPSCIPHAPVPSARGADPQGSGPRDAPAPQRTATTIDEPVSTRRGQDPGGCSRSGVRRAVRHHVLPGSRPNCDDVPARWPIRTPAPRVRRSAQRRRPVPEPDGCLVANPRWTDRRAIAKRQEGPLNLTIQRAFVRDRGGGIRTHGFLVPNQARYQTALHPGTRAL